MARAMLAVGLLVGAACSPSPGAPRAAAPTSSIDPTTTTTSEATTTTEPEPTTTTTEAPEPVEEAPPTPPVTRARSAPTTVPYVAPVPAQASGSGRCGGDLPPCYVMNRESGGDPTAIGYGQCGAENCYGKWQIHPDTAEAYGYPRRMDQQPESVQDAAAREIYANDGCQAWSTC